jgi:hypothetical protein
MERTGYELKELSKQMGELIDKKWWLHPLQSLIIHTAKA